MRRILVSIFSLLVLCSVGSTGCTFRPYLQWSVQAPAPVMEGLVAVKYVPNHRPPKEGGEAISSIGYQRSGWGIPFNINLEGENPSLDRTVFTLVSQALATAGIGMTVPANPQATSHMAIEINQFWCDGYFPVFNATVALEVVLLDPRTAAVRLRVPVRISEVNSDCQSVYRDVLNKTYQYLVNAFRQPQVRVAAVMVNDPAPAQPPVFVPPPPAAPAKPETYQPTAPPEQRQ